jgi:hypothetical protein
MNIFRLCSNPGYATFAASKVFTTYEITDSEMGGTYSTHCETGTAYKIFVETLKEGVIGKT